VLLGMPWTERGNADSDEKPGVIAVQISLCHHVVRDVARLPTLVKFIADLMTRDDRALPGREGDALGRERSQEVAIDRVGMRGRGCDRHKPKQRDRQDKDGRAHLGGRHLVNLSAQQNCEFC
jgi:hypothetical protein